MPEPRRLIQVSEIEGRTVVRFTNRQPILFWGYDHIESVAQELVGLVGDDQQASIILDFEGQECWLHANFEGRLVVLQRSLEKAGGTLRLCNLSPSILDQFRSNGLVRFFHIFPSLEHALDGSSHVG